MRLHHGIFLILVLLAGYFVGVKWPSMGASALSKVGL